jgi:predicted DCC family thiol-disulfide oxidoreductase YuxK
MKEQEDIILFDGVCNFCNQTVQFIIRNERQAQLQFASLQSETGQRLLKEHRISSGDFGTFVYIRNGRAWTRSTAGLLLTLRLKGLWPLLSIFLIIPWFIRDIAYNIIAKKRYKWWGRTDSCQLPSPEIRKRFIDL